jgi:hypothetical protein
MDACVSYGSPFLSAFVVFALRHYTGTQWIDARVRALQFLQSEAEPGGWWRNHNRLNPLHTDHQLPLDLDDTAVISQILTFYGVSFEDNRAAIQQHTDEQGLYLTWIKPAFHNETDPVVNANALFYLSMEGSKINHNVVEWLVNTRQQSQWYPDRLALHYSVARAYANGVGSLRTMRTTIVNDILARQDKSGGFGSDLSTALALNSLHNFGCRGCQYDAGLQSLLRRQAADGSWAIAAFYRGWKNFYGSSELTTALAVDALLSS